MNSNKIALFDSGVGQLSVYLEIKKLLPRENFVIFADQKNMPYGEKSPAQIKKYVTEALEFLIKNHRIKMMILACNTATVLALDQLRKNFSIPIIGVVPAIKPAAEISKSKRIVNMSTPATAKSPYLDKLVKKYAKNCKLLKLGCPGLENAIETLSQKEIVKMVKKYAKEINNYNPDVVVLGCTHYPLVKKQLKDNLNAGIYILDSGEAIARQASKVLMESGQTSNTKSENIYFTTGDSQEFSRVCSTILGEKIAASQIIL